MIGAMTMDARKRKSLVGRSHPLKPIVHVGRHGLQASQIETIRQHLAKTDLVKVKVDAADGDEADAMAAAIVEGVPCELVARRGYVLILYSEASDED